MTLPVNMKHHANNLQEISDAEFLTKRQMAAARKNIKRKASELFTPHLLPGNITSVNNFSSAVRNKLLASLEMSAQQTQPALAYMTNELKRTKANQICHNITTQTQPELSQNQRSSKRNIATVSAVHEESTSPTVSRENVSVNSVQRTNPAENANTNPLLKSVCKENDVLKPMNPLVKFHSSPDLIERLEMSSSGDELRATEKRLTANIHQGHNHLGEGQFQTKVRLDENCNPQDALISILQEAGYKAETRKSSEMKDFFLKYNESHVAAYDQEVVSAIRSKDIQLLRELHRNGKNLQAANKYGESLVHMACRRGHTEVLRFLINEADVTLRVRDDYGRTPLHDACWSAEPNFELMDFLLEHEPDLLLVEDSRGHFPFSYVRRNHWKQWNDFLLTRRGNIRLRTFKEPIISRDEASFVVS